MQTANLRTKWTQVTPPRGQPALQFTRSKHTPRKLQPHPNTQTQARGRFLIASRALLACRHQWPTRKSFSRKKQNKTQFLSLFVMKVCVTKRGCKKMLLRWFLFVFNRNCSRETKAYIALHKGYDDLTRYKRSNITMGPLLLDGIYPGMLEKHNARVFLCAWRSASNPTRLRGCSAEAKSKAALAASFWRRTIGMRCTLPVIRRAATDRLLANQQSPVFYQLPLSRNIPQLSIYL